MKNKKNKNYNKQNFPKNETNTVNEEIILEMEEIEIEMQTPLNLEDNNENIENDSIEIVGVKFGKGGKTYYFSPNGIKLQKGDYVVVETATGLEIGFISFENFSIKKEKLVEPLKPILRKATDNDMQKYEKIKEKEKFAKQSCQKLAEKYKLDMKLVDVTLLLDESKLIFSFTSEGRVDFRELVKDLASEFKTRIEMHQIGVRDEARMVGCYGMCGQECCCSRFLSDYEKVSVKMAKNQNLSLNPQKISGICGRLLCCLGYENEHYLETLKQMPKVGSKIDTPDGEGIVTYNNLISKFVSAKVKIDEDNFELKQYPLEQITIYEKNIVNDKHSNDNEE